MISQAELKRVRALQQKKVRLATRRFLVQRSEEHTSELQSPY